MRNLWWTCVVVAAACGSPTGIAPEDGVMHPELDALQAGGLHVVMGNGAGNGVLVDGTGATVRLHGVDRAGTEYACLGGNLFSGPSDQASIDAMKAWHINAVRVPLNEDCWLGINGVPVASSGAPYQAAIRAYVSLLEQNGMYVILDLHWA